MSARAAILALAVLLAAAAPAGARTYVGGGADARGDQAAGAGPGADLTAASLEYQADLGRITAVVTMAGNPRGAAADLGVIAGTRTAAGGCDAPATVFLSPLDGPTTQWARDDDGEGAAEARGFGSRRFLSGNRVLLTAEQLFLRDLRYECLLVVTERVGRVGFDSTPVFALAERPPAPRLVVSVSGLPRRLKPGRAAWARVRITNLGDAPGTEVRLAVGRARGLSAKLARRYFTLVPVGRSVSTRLKVRVGRRARKTTKVGIAARAATGPRARRTLTVRRR